MPIYNPPPLALGRSKASGAVHYGIPGLYPVAQSTAAIVVDRVRYDPLFVETPITLTLAAMEVTTLGASSAPKLALFTADLDLQPVALVADWGTIDASTTGIKTITISQPLGIGRYLVGYNTNVQCTVRTWRIPNPPGSLTTSLGASSFYLRWYVVSQPYSGFPASFPAWAGGDTGATSFESSVLFTWTPS